ncbi:MAG: Spi family protease inhibitor, partial [Bacteroidaceae bacterium]|nr:Spi family protease inhibitor [Bacteroidaceae bacterium]
MKRNLLFLIGCLLSLIGMADPIGRQQALNTAREYLSAHGKTLEMESVAFKAPRKDASSIEEKAYYYVFNVGNDNGYVIVSGDDRTDQILGYVEKGSFDEENLPDNMRSWLQLYADQIK